MRKSVIIREPRHSDGGVNRLAPQYIAGFALLVLSLFAVGSAGAKCPIGDLSGDCKVDLKDLQVLADQWLNPSGGSADLTDDDDIIMVDFALLAANWHQKGIPLAINEVMASNSSTVRDDQGEYDDWIEIHNYGGEAIDVGGIYLTDDLDQPTMWRIPDTNPSATTIPAGGYLLVWADGDITDPGLHTNFRLSALGDQVGLFAADGSTLIDSVIFDDQRPDISYGRYPDANDYLRFLAFPTPGTANYDAYLGFVGDTRFSQDRGFYAEPFSVTISTETEGALIYYTLDGSSPYSFERGQPTGIRYISPIPITTTTALRAVAFKHGFKPSNVDTHTYIFLDDVIRQPAQPPGFLTNWGHTGQGDYEMDPDVVNNPLYRDTIKDDLKSVATLSLVMDRNDWFGSGGQGIYIKGERIERACSAEFILPDSSEGFQVNCTVMIVGGSSPNRWKMDKLSLRLKFKGQYGPSKLRFPLFGDEATDQFDTVVVDACMNNTWPYGGGVRPAGSRPFVQGRQLLQRDIAQYTRDQFVADIQNATGGFAPHGRHVHLYLNGLYWGLYWLHERPDEHFAAAYFGGDDEDYDVLKHNSGTVINGSRVNYIEMCGVADAGLSSAAQYQLIQRYLDLPNFINYMITNYYVGNSDWAHQNWYATRSRVDPNGKWRYHSWDAEHVMEDLNENVTGKDDAGGPTHLHRKLAENAEYRMLFANHVHRHFFNNGVLTPQGAAALYRVRLNEVDRAVVGESARWGDNQQDKSPYITYTRDEHWVAERDWLLSIYFPQRTAIVLAQFKARGWYPNVDAPVFYINGSYQHGGQIAPNDGLSMTAKIGTIYYTLDGSDPRVLSGAVNTSHTGKYSAAIRLTQSTHIKARVLSGSTWSALNEAVFAVGPVKENLRITEIMYNPGSGNQNEEYIELKNTCPEPVEGVGSQTINLNLARFTNGIDFTFPSIELAPAKYVLVVKDQAAFSARYPDFAGVIAGQYSGSLANEGERIRLEDAVSQTIMDFKYSDAWRDITDGRGFSLTIVNPANPDINSWGQKDSWRASAFYGGSPGWDDTGIIPEPGSVVINEVLAHAHADSSDWIELHNTTGETINIGGWFLSDDGNDPSAEFTLSAAEGLGTGLTKYQIADGTVITANGYLVFYQDQHFGNPADPGCHRAFALSENGDQVYLSSAQDGVLTGYQEVEDFGASQTGVSFGRYYKGSTDNYNFVAMSQNTPGAANAYPKVGPIVINEIMYNPGSGNQDEEYIELYNVTGEPVSLYDYVTSEPWRFTDGIEFVFSSKPVVTIPAGGYLLVVKHPDSFVARYGEVPAGVVVVGPYDGQLKNGGEKLELSMPGDVDALGQRYYIRVDRVNFSDGSHPEDQPGGVDLWPVEADGGGMSLSRKISSAYGNDVANWKAATPSPGGTPH